jgi:diacylglycerol kinase
MKGFLKSFLYAFNGLVYAFKSQLNFKVHCVAAVIVILTGAYLGLSNTEWALIAVAIGLVIVVELVNTAIEVLVDLVSPGQHPKAGAIKDIAAAAVLIAAVVALAIGLLIFIPKLL